MSLLSCLYFLSVVIFIQEFIPGVPDLTQCIPNTFFLPFTYALLISVLKHIIKFSAKTRVKPLSIHFNKLKTSSIKLLKCFP